MPSPMMLGWLLMSLTRRTGPRLMPVRNSSVLPAASASRSARPRNRPSSGSPRKLTAAPSPVSRMMRSLTGTSRNAAASNWLSSPLIRICSATGFFENSTMSMKTTVQRKLRLPLMVCAGLADRLFDAHARLGAGIRGQDEQARRVAAGGEHHAFGHAEFHLARRKVGDHHRQPANQRRRVVG